MAIFLETNRLILRKFCEEDFEDFCAFAMDNEMCRMMGRALMPNTEAARWNFNWLKDKEERGYALVYKENNRVIGNLTITSVMEEVASMEPLVCKKGKSLSFSIGRQYQRRGLMEEAMRAVIHHLFYTEGVDYIHCSCYSFNAPSRELQKKLGFQHIATLQFTEDGQELTSEENVLWRP